jgi:glycosyl transferase, family 25
LETESTVAHRSGLPPIWVINLRRSADRRAYISHHLGALGLAFELVEAVDGRELSRETLGALYDPVLARRKLSRELTLGEIGCALSHLRLYRRMLDEDVPEVLILEDDVVIDPACIDILRRPERFPSGWELILLFHNGGHPSYWGRRPLNGTHQIVRFASQAWGCGGYLLRKSAAEKLLRRGYPVRTPSDGLTGGPVDTGVVLYGVSPPPIVPLPEERAPSTMPEAYVFRAMATREQIGWLRFAVQSARVRLFHGFHKYRPLLPRRASQ